MDPMIEWGMFGPLQRVFDLWRSRKAEQQRRIERVVDKYLVAARSKPDFIGETDGLAALLRAGALTLQSSGEIEEACSLIYKHGETDPIALLKQIPGVDTRAFLEYANRTGADLRDWPLLLASIIEFGGDGQAAATAIFREGPQQPTITPDRLAGLFANRTEIQGQRLVQHFIGRWITVVGEVSNVTGKPGERHVQVSLVGTPSVFLYFESNERLASLPRGATITARGRIGEVLSWLVSLEDCEILNVDKRSRSQS
jgi:hypothetical protein